MAERQTIFGRQGLYLSIFNLFIHLLHLIAILLAATTETERHIESPALPVFHIQTMTSRSSFARTLRPVSASRSP